jgi:hypothetical protein
MTLTNKGQGSHDRRPTCFQLPSILVQTNTSEFTRQSPGQIARDAPTTPANKPTSRPLRKDAQSYHMQSAGGKYGTLMLTFSL